MLAESKWLFLRFCDYYFKNIFIEAELFSLFYDPFSLLFTLSSG